MKKLFVCLLMSAFLLFGCGESKNDQKTKIEVPEITVSATESCPGEVVTLSVAMETEGQYSYRWQFKNERLYYPENAEFDDIPVEIPLVPLMMEKSRFESALLSKMPYKDANGEEILDEVVGYSPYKYLNAFYSLKDPFNKKLAADSIIDMQEYWPITKKYAVRILGQDTTKRDIISLEYLITNYTDYTYSDLFSDMAQVEYDYHTNKGYNIYPHSVTFELLCGEEYTFPKMSKLRDNLKNDDGWRDICDDKYRTPGGGGLSELVVTPATDTDYATEYRCIVTDSDGTEHISESAKIDKIETDTPYLRTYIYRLSDDGKAKMDDYWRQSCSSGEYIIETVLINCENKEIYIKNDKYSDPEMFTHLRQDRFRAISDYWTESDDGWFRYSKDYKYRDSSDFIFVFHIHDTNDLDTLIRIGEDGNVYKLSDLFEEEKKNTY